METSNPGGGSLQLLLLLAFLIPAIFFLLTQQNTLKAIKAEHRLMDPGLVWLQLIPIFNYFWIFFVVKRIAGSLAREFAGRSSDSVFELADMEAVRAYGKRPTYGIGLAYSILFACLPLLLIMFNFIGNGTITITNRAVAIVVLLTSFMLILTGMVCWIVYWVQLVQYKNKLKRGLAVG